MSKKQLRRAHVLHSYNEQAMSRKAAAEALGLSERRITRLAKGMIEEGERALIHKNTGRKPANAIAQEKRAQIVKIRQTAIYEKSNISHFKELPERDYQPYKLPYPCLQLDYYHCRNMANNIINVTLTHVWTKLTNIAMINCNALTGQFIKLI